MNILWRGARGPAVQGLQQRLLNLGLYTGKSDGVFGPQTEKAVKAYQRSEKLAVDGIAGRLTLARIGLYGPLMVGKPKLKISRRQAAAKTAVRQQHKVRTVLLDDMGDNMPPGAEEEATSYYGKIQPPVRAMVFISYSHADAKWLKRLRVHLAPLERQGMVDAWDDTRIRPGTRWREKIAAAIKATKVAVLLLSADFTASDFIAKNELPPLLDAANERRTAILCVALSPCDPGALSAYQFVNSPDKTLAEMETPKRERVWLKLVESITTAVNN